MWSTFFISKCLVIWVVLTKLVDLSKTIMYVWGVHFWLIVCQFILAGVLRKCIESFVDELNVSFVHSISLALRTNCRSMIRYMQIWRKEWTKQGKTKKNEELSQLMYSYLVSQSANWTLSRLTNVERIEILYEFIRCNRNIQKVTMNLNANRT